MSNVKVLLVPEWALGKDLVVEATVEAEYGSNVIRGLKATLAHHLEEFLNQPAPCNNKNVPVLTDGTIVISHIDLDTVGGVMALIGIKPPHDDFWSCAEYIDLNGPHNVHKVSNEAREMLEAYWAWFDTLPKNPKPTEITDVTDTILLHADIISKIINGDKELIEKGKKWSSEKLIKEENCLIDEDEDMRVFVTDDVFTAASYYSPTFNRTVSVTVNFNTRFKSITVATSDDSINARELVQDLWGPEAGGRSNIAGSPRGKKLNLRDLNNTVQKVKDELRNY